MATSVSDAMQILRTGKAPAKKSAAPAGVGTAALGALLGPVGQAAAQAAQRASGTIPVAPKNPGLTTTWAAAADTGGGGGGWVDPAVRAANEAAAAQARANAQAKANSKKQNDATRDLAQGQRKLIDSFGTQRDIKLSNINATLERGQQLLLKNYFAALGNLEQNRTNNDAAEADATFRNVANAVRERQDLLTQAAAQGAGETDLLKTQLQALRNFGSNQGEVNRAFFDTLTSINSSISGLNSDTATSRQNMFNQAESDKESAWANYYNQTADTWTQIHNIENSNTNTDSDTSEAYVKTYANAADEAAKAAAGSYKRLAPGADLTDWSGKGKAEERQLNTANRAATVNLGAPMKKPEGATLRRW